MDIIVLVQAKSGKLVKYCIQGSVRADCHCVSIKYNVYCVSIKLLDRP